MGLCTSAFFGDDEWPGRVWAAGRVFASALEQSDELTRVTFIESYAGERASVEKVEAAAQAFQVFFQDGYRMVPPGRGAPTQVAVEATIATVFEIIYHQSRASSPPALVGLFLMSRT